MSRLKDASDVAAWQIFMSHYWRLILQVCLRTGLTRQEAEEVAQETGIAVAREMPRFEYDRSRGSFKGWLARVTRNHIADFLEKKTRETSRWVDLTDAQMDAIETRSEGAAGESAGMEALWESEWRQHLMTRALACVQQQLSAGTVQIFRMTVLEKWSIEKTAAALRLNKPQVYLARHRAARLVKKEIGRLRKTLE